MAKTWTGLELMEISRAFQATCVVTAATDLDVFTALGDGRASAGALAERLGADLRGLTILLDALAALGLLDKEGDLYRAAPGIVELLSAESPQNILPGVLHQSNCLRRWAQLAQVVRSGGPAERTASIRGAEADCEAFIGAMNTFSEAVAPEIVGKVDPLRFQRLLDIGGASGTWTIAFLRAVPEATAVLFDLPEVIPMARERLTAAGLIDRVTLVPGDYNVDPLPAGADLAWLSAIVHQNSPAQNQTLYAKIHAALAPGGTLVIRDIVMDTSRTAPPSGALFAVNMLVATEGGNSYTLDEFRDHLTGAGFDRVEQVYVDAGMNSLVQARKD